MVDDACVKGLSGRITASGVQRTFFTHDGDPVHALAGVDLDIGGGEFVSLLGPSGCGKSTFLRLIAGLDHPDAGNIAVDGQAVSKPGYERGLIFQDPNLFPWRNVKRNVQTGLEARTILKDRKTAVAEYIALVGLEGFERAYPHQLSGGMAQRVALARALINHPTVILMDEPLGALDAFTRMSMQDEILRIWSERRTTVVLVTHDIDEALYMSDRIVILSPRPGRVQEILTVKSARPRQRNDPEFLHERSILLEKLHFAAEHRQPDYIL